MGDVEMYGKRVFGFVLSFAAFTREQAFNITVAAFIQTLKERGSGAGEAAFLEELFRRVMQESESVPPSGDAGLSAFGDLPSHNKGSLGIVREGFLQLSPENKKILLLRDQCHFSFETIGGILQLPPLRAKSSCLAARELFREAVQAVLKKKAG